ncbi:Phosphoenolpyruvate/pyruvate domain-containing protein [Aspergillus campestris IBT 28561]|uniref:Phosphoenolpyruvate/pyruvate domain-containing protein n=1 Tax=Aspergillus campestris (strain IBT 28561) TaxID=1392248 RepID=A0A2I1D2Y2_ASPC2|nr:Phosphoenolpyruvate/pyruvate domain-containing protein [Aspergillus campestris IBT 28561]PKY04234.1 Phosphoenolpyruvate/pyruvate domain-containing protein [Aspergillus campestris IBT 28561]
MPFPTPITTTLQNKQTAFGFWLMLPSAPAARIILRAASAASSPHKLSWVLVDGEHGLITDREYYELTTAIGSCNASPIIRVPWGEEWMIKRALDAGAHGILTPMCHSAEDATRIVQYTKYPPTGSRGYGPAFAAHSLPDASAAVAYDEAANDSLVVMVQIESQRGVDNVEEIARVEGLDGVLIGPFDLAKQMGVVRGGDEHEAAIQRILKAAKSAGKTAAIFCTNGEQARERAQQGFDMISIMTDVGAFEEGMMRNLGVAGGSAGVGEGSGGY